MIVTLDRGTDHIIYKLADGSIVPGASTIAGVNKDCNFLMSWAHKLGKDGKDYRKATNDAADAGTIGHFLIECYLKGNEPDLANYIKDGIPDPAIALGHIVLEKFLREWDKLGLTFVEGEVPLVSEQYRFGGTLDIVARDREQRMCLIDIKSSKGIYNSHILQVAGYEILHNEHRDEKIQRRAIFRHGRLDKDSDSEVEWIEDISPYTEAFLARPRVYAADAKLPRRGFYRRKS